MEISKIEPSITQITYDVIICVQLTKNMSEQHIDTGMEMIIRLKKLNYKEA